MMRVPQKLLNLGLVLSSLGCYMEWGGGNARYVAQIEYEILFRSMDASSLGHPLVLAPFAGQLLLLFTLFQKRPGRWLTFAGVLLLGVLVLMLALVSVLSRNLRMGVSVLPFLLLAGWSFLRNRKPT